MDAENKKLRDTLIVEIINAIGLPCSTFWFRLFYLAFHKPAERLAAIGREVDQRIAQDGADLASAWILRNWCQDIKSNGRERIPLVGPLLVVSNHVGAYDTFVICSQLGRKDFKVITSDIPFLKNLPNACKHAIFLSPEPHDRMSATRAGIRHLQSGGSLLIFGTGLVDPDPAVYPGASKQIESWSPSINLFLRTIPDISLLTCIVSGVLSSKWAHHPITWLRSIAWQKRRIAEFGQVLYQLFYPGHLYVSPRISFSQPVDFISLKQECNSNNVLPAVISRGKSLLKEHCTFFGDCAML